MNDVTVVVLTRNEAPRLAACLESIRGLTDRIVVVDSQSDDETAEVARRFTPEVHVRDWPGRAAQTRFAVDQAQTEWILQLDADEVCPPALCREIAQVLASAPPAVEGYTLGRVEDFLGRRIRCGHHAGILRLCRKSAVETPIQRAHAPLAVSGEVRALRAPLVHAVDQPLDELFEKWIRRAWLSAQDYRERGRRATVWSLLWHPAATWLRLWILKGGCLDGMPGLVFCGLRAAYCFARLANLYALQQADRTAHAPDAVATPSPSGRGLG